MTRLFTALLAAMWLALAASNAIANGAPLRVATAADHPPLTYQADGKIVGMEADFARLLEQQLGRPLQLQILPAADLLPALARGDVDLVMSGLVITPEREKLVEFTVPYLRTGQMALIRTADVMRFHNPTSLLQGKFRVGFVADSAGAAYVKSTMANATAVPCNNSAAGLQALLDKSIDVFIDDAATSWGIATESRYGELMSLNQPLTEEFLAWAVNKNNPQLREQLNQVLFNMKKQQVFQHILNRWVPVAMPRGDN